ncbi:AzlC family ABC transporter permease [Roseococcus sp. DSY-14]|uniref:AzlC family ABC transporter permease n=1 Tax=Roseococcus sp. DSY-14 TaxID=3369650 RepID=UPI00387B1984
MSGIREALGAPALAMAATFLAFGAAAGVAGWPAWVALLASLGVYGMPGQMIWLGGGGVPAALAANARFLPMAVALAPWLGGGKGRWWALPFIAVTPWAMAMRRLPGLPPPERLGWFLQFALASWMVAGVATLAGWALAGRLPLPVLALLLLVNPLYFGLILLDAARLPAARAAVLGGLAALPLAWMLPPSLGLLAAGVAGGTAAFCWNARRG